MNAKTYIHEGGQLGDFDFLYEVLERDQILKLSGSVCDYWKRKRTGPFCATKTSEPTTHLYERLKGLDIRPDSKADNALIKLVEYVSKKVVELGHNYQVRS